MFYDEIITGTSGRIQIKKSNQTYLSIPTKNIKCYVHPDQDFAFLSEKINPLDITDIIPLYPAHINTINGEAFSGDKFYLQEILEDFILKQKTKNEIHDIDSSGTATITLDPFIYSLVEIHVISTVDMIQVGDNQVSSVPPGVYKYNTSGYLAKTIAVDCTTSGRAIILTQSA